MRGRIHTANEDRWSGYTVTINQEIIWESAFQNDYWCTPVRGVDALRPDGYGYNPFSWPKDEITIIDEESDMTTETVTTTNESDDERTTVRVGDRIVILGCNPGSFIGYTGTMVEVGYHDGAGVGRGYIHLDPGQKMIAGYETYFPEGPNAQQNMLSVRETARYKEDNRPFRMGDLVKVTHTYGEKPGDDPAWTDGKLAEWILTRQSDYDDYPVHRVRVIEDGETINVRGVERVSGSAALREAREEVTAAKTELAAQVAKIKEDHEAWKAEASIKAMRVAIDNSMCAEAERAMRKAGLPTTIDAEVRITLTYPVAVRDYVNALDNESGFGVYQASNALAEMTNVPSYKWQERIKAAEFVKAAPASVNLAPKNIDEDDDIEDEDDED